MDEASREKLLTELHKVNAIKTGSFLLKSGSVAPVYFDLRVIISFPNILTQVCDALWEKVKDLKFDLVCGVPYTALPLATVIAVKHNVPMVLKRSKVKDYGTRCMVEGKFETGQKCLVVEDVVTSGSSVYETVQELENVGLKVTDAVVLMNREQGGPENLKNKGITLHSVYDSTKALDILLKHKTIEEDIVTRYKEYLKKNQEGFLSSKSHHMVRLPFSKRADLCSNKLAKELFKLMEDKQTNLCLSADVMTFDELLKLADSVGPHICILKTHVDILEDFDMVKVERLVELAGKHKFLLFEDRKFADIGNTVNLQYTSGLHKISQWANITNAHSVSGSGILEGLKKGAKGLNRGCLLIAEMSSAGNLISKEYTEATVALAKKHQDFVIGFICQSRVSEDATLLNIMPGIKFETGGDNLGQQYSTPKDAIMNKGADVIIVGRGIFASEDPSTTAQRYKVAAFEAYINACNM